MKFITVRNYSINLKKLKFIEHDYDGDPTKIAFYFSGQKNPLVLKLTDHELDRFWEQFRAKED